MIAADEYAAAFLTDLRVGDTLRGRNLQTHRRLLGVSDIYHCREYGRLFLSGHPFTDTPDDSAARAGTYYHLGALTEIGEARPDALIEQELTVTLSNGFEVIGHADLIEPDEPSATDLKTVDDTMPAVRRNGATPQQRSQRGLYYAGAHQAGLVPAKGITRNIWIDRSGKPTPPHVEQSPYDPTVLDDAARWVDEVAYAVQAETPAPRDKDFFFCEQFCPFFTACRIPGDKGEVVESDELAQAAALNREATRLEKEAKGYKQAAAEVLSRVKGEAVTVRGEAGTFRVASTWVGPSDVAYERKGHYRMTIKEARDV